VGRGGRRNYSGRRRDSPSSPILKGATADVRAQAALEIGRHLNAAQEELARCIEYIKQTPGASSLDDSFLRTEIEKHLEQMQSKAKATHQLLEKLSHV
jgi:hypothetical protein